MNYKGGVSKDRKKYGKEWRKRHPDYKAKEGKAYRARVAAKEAAEAEEKDTAFFAKNGAKEAVRRWRKTEAGRKYVREQERKKLERRRADPVRAARERARQQAKKKRRLKKMQDENGIAYALYKVSRNANRRAKNALLHRCPHCDGEVSVAAWKQRIENERL